MHPRIQQLVDQLSQLPAAQCSRLLDSFFRQINETEPVQPFENLNDLRKSALEEIESGQVLTWDDFFEQANFARPELE